MDMKTHPDPAPVGRGVGRLRPRDHRLHPAAPPPTASTRSAASAPSASCRTSTIWCSSAGSLSRYPLEGYRERCATKTVLGTRYAKKPIELDIPITIAGMSFGALSANVKEALGRAATEMGTSTTTGDGGMTPEERGSSKTLVYQCLPSRYGFNPDDLRRADAIEVVIGQGAKPGGGGMLLGQKVSPRVAEDAHAARRHRPALGLPPSRLDRPRRPRHQDPGTARDHRLGEADLREGRRDARLPRREAGGARRRRRGRGRRHAGRHRRDADRASSSTWASPRWRRCARRSRRSKT